MSEPSRRAVLAGIGSAAFTILTPAMALAGLPEPVRSLETILGPERMARAKFLWSQPRWPFGGIDRLVDASDRFILSPIYRDALTAIMNGCEAVRFDEPQETGSRQRHTNANVLELFSWFDLLPPRLGIGIDTNYDPFERSLHFTIRERWRDFGWSKPLWIAQEEWQPDATWMMTGKKHSGTPYRLRELSDRLGWEPLTLEECAPDDEGQRTRRGGGV